MSPIAYRIAATIARLNRLFVDESKKCDGTRVLMFHDLNMDAITDDVYSLPFEQFSSGMHELKSWAEAERVPFVAFASEPQHGVAVTFDDGYSSTGVTAYELLSRLSIPFHVFVTKTYVLSDDRQYLSISSLRSLAANPLVTFGIHGVTHTPFTKLPTAELVSELNESRSWLEDTIGKPVLSVSYPHGDYDERVIGVVQECGFKAAACSKVGTFRAASQRFAVPRIDIWALDSAKTIVNKVRGHWDFLLR